MKIKLDENIPTEIAELLAARDHEVDTVVSEGLRGAPDGDVWARSQAERRLLITQDLDFSDIRQFRPGSHAGLILVRLHQATRQRLAARLQGVFSAIDVGTWQRCLVVVSEHRIRVRRPPASAK